MLCLAITLPFMAYLTPRVRPSVLLSLGLVLSVFSGSWGRIGIPIPIDRLFVVGGLFSIWCNPQMRASLRSRLDWVAVWLAVFSAYVLVSFYLHEGFNTGRGFWGIIDRVGIAPFVMFFVAPVAFATARDRDFLYKALVVLGGYLSVTAIFEVLGPSSLIFPQYIGDPSHYTHWGRARGPFIEAVANGMAIFCCGVVSLFATRSWKASYWRTAALAVAGLCVFGAFLSMTRSVWLGSLVAAVVGCLVVPAIRKYLIPGLVATVVVMGSLLMFVPALHEQATSRLDQQSPIWDRVNTNNAAIEMIKAQPLFGFGWNQFEKHSADYMKQSDIPLTAKGVGVHNIALAFGADLGLVGVAMWGIGLIAAIGGALLVNSRIPDRVMAGTLVAIFTSWFFVAMLTPLSQAFPNLLLWMWAGIALAHANDAEEEVEIDLRDSAGVTNV